MCSLSTAYISLLHGFNPGKSIESSVCFDLENHFKLSAPLPDEARRHNSFTRVLFVNVIRKGSSCCGSRWVCQQDGSMKPPIQLQPGRCRSWAFTAKEEAEDNH